MWQWKWLHFKDTQKSLNSLAKMVMDNCLTLDFLLAEQGRVCAIADITCCSYINTSEAVEEWANHILEHAK
jgi:hypothetical protein